MTQQNAAIQQTGNGEFGDKIEVLEPIAMSQLGGEVDVQIATAKRYPRSIKTFKDQAMQMATFDEATAAGCFYSLPRGGKPIEGPSARLAEIVLSAWGNVRADAKVVAVEDKEVVAEAMTWDLEKNVAIRVQVRRRITDKNGRRYNDDMITVTGNAACAIALRNSVFKVIPNVFTNAIYHAARLAAIGDIKTIAATRADMVDYFGKMGVPSERVFAAVGKSNIEEIGLDELASLKGVATAIKDGDISVDNAFPPVVQEASGSGVASLKDRIAKNAGDAPASATDIPEPAANEATDTATADTTTKLSKAEGQKADQITWIKEFEKESDENGERVAQIIADGDLDTMTPGQVKEIYLELQK